MVILKLLEASASREYGQNLFVWVLIDVGAISSGIRNHLLVCVILSYLLVIVSTYHHTIKVKQSQSLQICLFYSAAFSLQKNYSRIHTFTVSILPNFLQ